MTTADFDARLTRLEDIEEIKQLKARYCAYCDDGYDPNGIAALFTEDGIWDGGRTFGEARGAGRNPPTLRGGVLNGSRSPAIR